MRRAINVRNRPVHLTLSSALVLLALTTATTALQGHVLSLDGHGDYMEIPDTPALHAAEDLTLTVWFRVDDPDVRHFGNPRYQWTVAAGSTQPWLRVPWLDQ